MREFLFGSTFEYEKHGIYWFKNLLKYQTEIKVFENMPSTKYFLKYNKAYLECFCGISINNIQ